jgi:hypothetical protein
MSHALLAVSALLAAGAAGVLGLRGRQWLGPAGVAAFFAALFLEEIDWGAVYGWLPVGGALEELLGFRNLHNSAAGFSYTLWALPLAVTFAAPLLPYSWARRWLAALGPLEPTRADVAAVWVIGFWMALSHGMGPWRTAWQEGLECALYAALFVLARRGLGAALAGEKISRRPGRPGP